MGLPQITLASVIKRLYSLIINERRLRELVRQITLHLCEGDSVLDVGCGSGALGQRLMESSSCPARVNVTGLENLKRGGEVIPVEFYDGHKIPYPDDSFDVVILSDVVHHESDPHNLIDECVRITRRLLIIKDHNVEGFLAQKRISLLDWAGNMPYGVPCLYRYNTAQEWTRWYERHSLVVEHEMHSLQIYPPILNLLFGRRLHYLAVLHTDRTGALTIEEMNWTWFNRR